MWEGEDSNCIQNTVNDEKFNDMLKKWSKSSLAIMSSLGT